ncbi:diguanylate cyclase [Pseudodesulfovibrio cashew]|uniref:Diguanylate cyclase n=1 Tax=Pseudodesulfovibrio cashew TaxID=2678688 RepID=A0A6I6JNL9_9BACT|nr:sensor domain-containing diguanylate cyclase [Pseudodesulfovibrio cashew]QGY39214.1 diguanylate cyclase [Pseudodesulfovibrio cashew]
MGEPPIQLKEKKIIKRALNLFLFLFLLFGSLLGGMVAIYYQAQLSNTISRLKEEEVGTLEQQGKSIAHDFDDIISDLSFLAGQNELREYLDTGDPHLLQKIAREYSEFALCKKMYDQVRFLDATGMEIVRVNYKAGETSIVPRSELQSKAKRYYFTDAIKLKAGEIFVSPLDLNIERGQIEQPLKPMMRFATPILDFKGEKRGIILVNYLAGELLETIRTMFDTGPGHPMLINNEGYFLLSEDPAKEWGFMIPERATSNFASSHPEEWSKITAAKTVQLRTDLGLFTAKKIFPIRQARVSREGSHQSPQATIAGRAPDNYFWVLMTHVPQETMLRGISQLRVKLFLLGAGLFVVISLIAWLLALAITKRRIYQSQLVTMALYDSLTELPNRKLFAERLERALDHAKRHGRRMGLLYVDLDGFKNVNDSLGHEAGDELLIQVSGILTGTTRKSDTVARLGGDEFAVILTEINSIEDAVSAGNKIIESLCVPFKLKSGTMTIGASIGASVYPDDADTIELLIKKADKAMYTSKANGKNNCTPATETT